MCTYDAAEIPTTEVPSTTTTEAAVSTVTVEPATTTEVPSTTTTKVAISTVETTTTTVATTEEPPMTGQ